MQRVHKLIFLNSFLFTDIPKPYIFKLFRNKRRGLCKNFKQRDADVEGRSEPKSSERATTLRKVYIRENISSPIIEMMSPEKTRLGDKEP